MATSITNYDIHDISRTAKTYALGGYYMVTPILSQQELCRRIIHHWVNGFGSRYNQTRQEAFATTHLEDSLEQVLAQLEAQYQQPPFVVMTSAREHVATETGKPLLSYQQTRRQIQTHPEIPHLLVLGTGYGIENECIQHYSDGILAPILGVAGYNHLSVRSAAAIISDRLFGDPDSPES